NVAGLIEASRKAVLPQHRIHEHHTRTGRELAVKCIQKLRYAFHRHMRPPELREGHCERPLDTLKRVRVGKLKTYVGTRAHPAPGYLDNFGIHIRSNHRPGSGSHELRPVAGPARNLQHVLALSGELIARFHWRNPWSQPRILVARRDVVFLGPG